MFEQIVNTMDHPEPEPLKWYETVNWFVIGFVLIIAIMLIVFFIKMGKA